MSSDEDDDYYQDNDQLMPHLPVSRDGSFAIGLPTDPQEFCQRLEKFVFPCVIDSIKNDEIFMSKPPQTVRRTLMLVDIVGFSSFAEVLPCPPVIGFELIIFVNMQFCC